VKIGKLANVKIKKIMTEELINNNPILKLTLDFSIKIVKYCDELQNNKKFVIAHQLLKPGTSIGANSFEAQNAESKADFIHKFKIAAKEAEETQYWLIICQHSNGYPDTKELLEKLNEINKVIGSILKSSKTK
jgi:four helix bundle protein